MKAIIAALIFLTPLITYGNSCDQRPIDAQCNFYSTCVEDKLHCQNTDYQYPVEYGDRFCREFKNKLPELSERGKLWVDRTMICLQAVLFDEMQLRPQTNCRRVSEVAFDSHHECYVRPTGFLKDGICPLWKDYKIIFETGRPWESVGTQYSRAVRKQVVKTASTCIGYWLGIKSKKSFDPKVNSEDMINYLQSVIQRFSENSN